jgi:biopolymer transport protein ExbD
MTSFNPNMPPHGFAPPGFQAAPPPGPPAGGPPAAPPEEEKKKRKFKKHRAHEKKLDISINSLLDILSVILVFLMKSYSTTTVQIKPSKELQVPFSWSANIVEESTSITVTLKHILMDDKPVITLEDGKIAEQDLSSGGLLIDKLFEKLQDDVAHQKKIEQRNAKAKFKGVVTIICDRYVPFPLLAQVMYTAGQAEYGQFKFALIRAER